MSQGYLTVRNEVVKMGDKRKLKKLFSDEDEEYILNNYLEKDYQEIANALGVKRHNVVYYLKRNGLEGNKKKISLTKEEQEYFIDNYQTTTQLDFAKLFGVSKSAIGHYSRVLGLNGTKMTTPISPELTSEQEAYILDNYKYIKYKEIADRIGCTQAQVRNCVVRHSLTGYSQWNDKNIKYLKENWKTKSDKELAEETNRSESAIYARRMMLNLVRENEVFSHKKVSKKDKNYKVKPRRWTTKEEEYIIRNYDVLSDLEMSRKLKRTPKSVKHKRLNFKLFRNNTISNQELEIANFLNKNNVPFEAQFYFNGYHYDFKIKDTLIEFNGDYYHCNPEVYPGGPINNDQEYTLIKDKQKKELAIQSGFSHMTIWEKDYTENKEREMDKLLAVSQR